MSDASTSAIERALALARAPNTGNVLGGVNLASLVAIGAFLWNGANQQLATMAEVQQSVARIEVRVAGIDALREQVAALARELELLKESTASATELRELQARVRDLNERLARAEECVRDRRRCAP